MRTEQEIKKLIEDAKVRRGLAGVNYDLKEMALCSAVIESLEWVLGANTDGSVVTALQSDANRIRASDDLMSAVEVMSRLIDENLEHEDG